jgi:DNA-binding IclR family transcriptional regulator
MRAVGAHHEVAVQRPAGECDPGPLTVEAGKRNAGDLKTDVATGVKAGRDQVLDDLLLPVHGDRAPDEIGEVDAVPVVSEAQLDALVPHALVVEALADAGLAQRLRRAVFQHTGAHPVLDVPTVAALEHRRVDALKMQQLREQQAGRPGTDDADLGVHADRLRRGAVAARLDFRSVEDNTVTGRALAILDAFSAEQPQLRLVQLSRRTGLPLTTTHRLVGELARWGALERDGTGAYRIGLRLWEVASLAPRSVGLREAALPILGDLYEATHQNVQLAVLDGTDAVYIERISARDAVHVVTRVGGRLPLHATGVGRVLLAHAPDELRERVLAGPLAAYTERTLTDPHRLRRELAEVRRTGVAITRGEIELISTSVAAPVWDGVQVTAAVSVVVPESHDPHRYVPAVVTAARGISRALTR